MKSIILAFAISLAFATAALAWTHGNLVLGNTFITDGTTILTNDSGSDNLLAQ